MEKIYFCEPNGTAYWIENNVLMFAPISVDGMVYFSERGEVESWDGCAVGENTVRAKLA